MSTSDDQPALSPPYPFSSVRRLMPAIDLSAMSVPSAFSDAASRRPERQRIWAVHLCDEVAKAIGRTDFTGVEQRFRRTPDEAVMSINRGGALAHGAYQSLHRGSGSGEKTRSSRGARRPSGSDGARDVLRAG